MIAADPTKPVSHVRPRRVELARMAPAPENDMIYRQIDPSDPEIVALAKSIRKYGQREPIVLSEDDVIISGHRRHAALALLGRKTGLCRYENVDSGDLRFLELLHAYNQQRIKTTDERMREDVIGRSDRDAAVYFDLASHSADRAVENLDDDDLSAIDLGPRKNRKEISEAKFEMFNAIVDAIRDLRPFWPVSDRKIHYKLLDRLPLYRNTDTGLLYSNDDGDKSYKDTCDLIVRGLLTGHIPWESIGDNTRPVITWSEWGETSTFVKGEVDGFLLGYQRALLQGQPRHIELVVEKNTLVPIIRPIAMNYNMPMTSGRGYASIHPRRDMAERFIASGKEALVVLIISDFDVDGEHIARSFARSMRDDFGIPEVKLFPYKVALTWDQVQELDLPPGLAIKTGGKRGKSFKAKAKSFKNQYGDRTWEVEAVDEAVLQQITRDAIDAVLDVDQFNEQVEIEKGEIRRIRRLRTKAVKAINEVIAEDAT